MWREIEERRRRLDALRPLTARSLRALEAWYDVELTYTSNAIEGNTLTRAETAIVLEKGLTVRGKPLRDHLEAIDHRDALGYVRRLAGRGKPIREVDVRQIHRLVLARSEPEEAGRYARHQRQVAGSTARLPSPAEIPPLMGDFGRWLARADPTPESAFEAHWRLVAIHPFADGNGRTARLLMNLILLRAGYPPVVIGPEQRPDYLDALEARRVTGDVEPHRRLMAARLGASVDHYLEVATREDRTRPARIGAARVRRSCCLVSTSSEAGRRRGVGRGAVGCLVAGRAPPTLPRLRRIHICSEDP